jgi:sporulation protein YlmC with PRC-barrel domain
MRHILFITCGLVALGSTAATAQQQPTGTAQQPEVAERCLAALDEVLFAMEEDGYWLAGWRYGPTGYGIGWADRPGGAPAQDPAAAPGAPQPGGMAGGPWGTTSGVYAPGYEMRVLHAAAHVLAQRGQQEACETVVRQLSAVYNQRITELEEAGVDPAEITSWRAEQIAVAAPVEKLGTSFRIEEVTGTEVRNHEDERLGTIEDVVLDPETGRIGYAIVAHGGFLGLGQSYAAVPWEQLSVTPGFNTFVLPVTAATLEGAPELDTDWLNRPEGYQQLGGQIDQYWQQVEAR